MMQSNYKHWNYIFCGHESFEFLLYKPWLTWFLWIWASWVEGSFLLGIQCSLSGLVNHDPPVTLGHMLPFFVLNWWCHQVFPLGSCAWLPTFCSSAGFGKLWRCFYSSLGKWDLWYNCWGAHAHMWLTPGRGQGCRSHIPGYECLTCKREVGLDNCTAIWQWQWQVKAKRRKRPEKGSW